MRQIRSKQHDCKFCGVEFETGPKLGSHIRTCKSRPDYEQIKEKILQKNRRINSRKEVREKISKSNQIFLDKNPDMIPFIRNSAKNKSYPEKAFESILVENKITGWLYNHRVGRYVYDFAFPEIKLDIEIDGQLHFTEKGIRHDKIRDEFSKGIGWEVLRITAKDVKNRNKHQDILNRVLEKINQLKGL